MPVEQIREFEKALYAYVDAMNAGLMKQIEDKKVLDDELKAGMTKVIKEAKERFLSEHQMAAAGAKA
jgi:F-type H+/Na+-transporting ATPase subunit alpha